MFFNPLFIDTSSAGAGLTQPGSKLAKSQYLFSDIIKISLSQNESADSESTPLFNLSLINGGSNIANLLKNSSIFNTAPAAENTSEPSAETILVEFLQYAFINQDMQSPEALKLQEMMKDKELLLSKEALTNTLSQLLQFYQPAGESNQNTKAALPTPDKIAAQILSSLDESGKAVLNFKNPNSQIKIELTKLNNQEKELFISTRIIPISTGENQVKSAEKNIANSTETVKTENMTENSAANGVTQAEESKSVSDTKPGTAINNQINVSANSTEVDTKAVNAAIQGSEKTGAIPVPVQASENKLEQNKSVETDKTKSAAPSVEAKEGSKEQNDYKVKVVEISSEKQVKEQEAKIFSISPFEKNIMKKSNVKYTHTEAAESKPAAEIITDEKGKEIKTVADAEKEILKSNNLLFTKNSAGTNTEVQESGKLKDETVKNASELKMQKTDVKTGLQDNKELADQVNGKTVSTENEQNKNAVKAETETSAKLKTNEISKNAKVVVEDSNKNNDNKKEAADSAGESNKKNVTEIDKSTQQQKSDFEQNDSSKNSNQELTEKKGSDSKQFTTQSVFEKERVLLSKDEIVKETVKYADINKTIKTYEIIKEIKGFIEQGNKSSMVLRLVPENLGNVKITVDLMNNMVQGRIDVDNDNVKQFVQTNMDSLKQSLQQSGINLGTLSVNVSSSDQKQPKQVAHQSKKKFSNYGNEDVETEAPETVKTKNLGYNSVDYIA